MLHDLDLYKEYYERFPKRAQAQWALIFSDDPAERQALEDILKMTQAAAVDDFIETSCWKDDLPDLAGNKGTADERLHRLRFVYLLQHSKLTTLTEHRLLTPLEHDLFDLVEEMAQSCTIDKLKKRAQSVMKDADRVADRAKRRWWKELEVQREKEDVPFAAVIDATAAETVEEFASIVEKDSPEIADSIRRGMATKKKKKGTGKRRTK